MTGSRFSTALRRWVDSGADVSPDAGADGRGIDWPRVLPFVLVHVGCKG